MKVIVITKFKDKYTRSWHELDDEFEVDSNRYNEIKKYVKKVKEKKQKIKKT